jgi:hypothetical protein
LALFWLSYGCGLKNEVTAAGPNTLVKMKKPEPEAMNWFVRDFYPIHLYRTLFPHISKVQAATSAHAIADAISNKTTNKTVPKPMISEARTLALCQQALALALAQVQALVYPTCS